MSARHQKHFVFSVLLHIVLLTVLAVSFEFHSPMPVLENHPDEHAIEATVMNFIPAEKPRKIEQRLVPPPPTPVKPLEPVKPVKTLEPPPKKTEAIALPDKKQKKLQEDLIQKQLLADMQKQQEKEQKKLKQKALQAEMEKEMRDLRAKALAQAMQQEIQTRVSSVKTQLASGVVDKYKALILQSISQHWLVPNGADKNRSALLMIRLAPGGVVLGVSLTKSSGDDALDRSARAAVLKASPLPVPSDPEEFEPFRQFVLKVKPEMVVSV